MTELIKTASKIGFPAKPDEPLALEQRREMVRKARSAKLYEPLGEHVNSSNVERLEPLLNILSDTSAQTRRRVHKMIEILLEPGAYVLSFRDLCTKMDVTYNNWWRTVAQYPAIWRFVNAIVIGTTDLEFEGRVHGAVAQRAIDGGHQDSRLYLELTKKLSRTGSKGGGGNTIIFIQDTMSRAEYSPKGSGPSTLDLEIVDAEP